MANRIHLNASGYITVYNNKSEILYRIPVVFPPEEITDTTQSSWQTESPVGRSASFMAYSSTGDTTFNLSLSLSDDYLPEEYTSFPRYLDAFRSLVYPDYKISYIDAHKVLVSFGSFQAYGIINSVAINEFGPMRSYNGSKYYIYAKVNLGVRVIWDLPPGSIAVRKTDVLGTDTNAKG